MNLQSVITVARQAGAAGIWLLNDCAPYINYETPVEASEEAQAARTAYVGLCEFEACLQDADLSRALDLREAGRILVIRFQDTDNTAPVGLTTLVGQAGYCRVCGCSQLNPCEAEDGPCSWVEADLCSACVVA